MISPFKITFVCLVPLLAAGCKSNPGSGMKDVEKTVAARVGQPVSWPQSAAERDQADAVLARLVHEPLTVDSAVQAALLNNRSLRATLEEIGIGRSDVLQAGLLRNPEFAASIRFPDRPPSGANSEFSLAGDFLDLLLMPLRKRVAAAQFEQTKLRVSHEILQRAAEVKTAYYTAQARQQLFNRLQAIVDLNEAGADLSARQHKAGNITDLALSQQQASFQQAKLEWSKTQAQLHADRERLNRLLGLWGSNTDWKIEGGLPPLPAQEIAVVDLESFAISERLDLAMMKQQFGMAGQALSLRAKTRYLPTAVRLGVDTERDSDRQRLTGPTLNFELPIFDRGQGEISRLEAQYRQAQWRVESLATDIRSEVRQARDALIAARDLTEFYSKIYLPQRIRIANETLLEYNAMAKSPYDLISAKEHELNAEREYVEAWRDYWISRAELEKALGGKLPSSESHSSQMTLPEKASSELKSSTPHAHE